MQRDHATGFRRLVSHSVVLSGFTQNIAYHDRIESADAAGTLTTSVDFEFPTARDTDAGLSGATTLVDGDLPVSPLHLISTNRY
jgi:hypothetical protein